MCENLSKVQMERLSGLYRTIAIGKERSCRLVRILDGTAVERTVESYIENCYSYIVWLSYEVISGTGINRFDTLYPYLPCRPLQIQLINQNRIMAKRTAVRAWVQYKE